MIQFLRLIVKPKPGVFHSFCTKPYAVSHKALTTRRKQPLKLRASTDSAAIIGQLCKMPWLFLMFRLPITEPSRMGASSVCGSSTSACRALPCPLRPGSAPARCNIVPARALHPSARAVFWGVCRDGNQRTFKHSEAIIQQAGGSGKAPCRWKNPAQQQSAANHPAMHWRRCTHRPCRLFPFSAR